ncbi:MAG: hypothetical protein ACRELA_21080 [Candidatus Rokuibacteriota bacterium]
MRREPLVALGAVTLAVGFLSAGHSLALPREEAILPIESHMADTRALAETHIRELHGLYADLPRCVTGVGVERHGIGFRRPRGNPAAPPSLTLWVWLVGDQPPRGADLTARAGTAFRRYGQPLFRQLVARSAVFADARVGGYGLVLTWLGPARREGRLVGESLAVFADKITAANFAHDTIAPTVFLTRSDVRAFDGQTELGSLRVSVEDDGTLVVAPGC